MIVTALDAPQDGSIFVKVRILHPVRGAAFSATAMAGLAKTATLDLRRSGASFVALGRIPVPATQPAGPVTVTVVVTYDGLTTTYTRTVLIRASGAGEHAPSPSGSPSPSPSPSPTA